MALTQLELKRLAKETSQLEPQEIITIALENYQDIAISFSGAEDVVLIDMAVRVAPQVSVFSLDTGRLHAQTYRFLEQVREHYGIKLELLSPDAFQLQTFIRDKGLFSFYRDGHGECCSVRKVVPLRRKLATLDAWITGQRRDQSPGTRTDIAAIEEDGAFSTEDRRLVKINPLANWSSAQVWDYIRDNDVPYNPLHEQGYISIGCEPCTRAVLPNQHEREGRWWWEEQTAKECGLHSANRARSA